MKFKRLGIEWGAAYAEAEATRITHGDAEIEIFVSEKNELIVSMPGAKLAIGSYKGQPCMVATIDG